ncbi:MAG: FG-GAP repeat protein, partial [Myxococcales bacterium]|nr:FG-GAP repeat protein [Myxococcales bacterium]
SVSGAGSVNGDGYADVIVGAPGYAAGQNAEGAAFVFLGSAAGIADGNPSTAHAQLESNQDTALLGFSVSGAGDVNGDGYADVIVGARDYSAGETFEGAAFVFLGSATGIADGNPSTAHAQLESNQASAFLGVSVSGAGDVNGDGFADVIVGADFYSAGQEFEGAAFVFLGSATGIADGNPSTAHAQLESNQAFALLGTSVSGAGDVNGDGSADVIVGANLYDDFDPRAVVKETNEGAAFVYLGTATGFVLLPEPSATASLISGAALLGWLHRRRRSPIGRGSVAVPEGSRPSPAI